MHKFESKSRGNCQMAKLIATSKPRVPPIKGQIIYILNDIIHNANFTGLLGSLQKSF